MKFVFTFCFLNFLLQAFPRTVVIGTGSGSVVQNNMQGLHPGDTLGIRAGQYELGGSFENLTGISIVNVNGLVDFKHTVTLGHLRNVTISGTGWKAITYGFRFAGFQGDAFLLQAPCRSLSLAYCEYRNVEGAAFNASHFFSTYTGADSTFALYKTCFRYQKLVHSGALFAGSWAANARFQNVVDSIAFLNIVVDSTSSDVCQVIGHSIYRMLASNWRITGPCVNGKHDAGIFQISGNGTVRNVYRRGGWGYIWRIWNVGLNGRADSYLYNCMDLGTDNYGTIDTRIDAGDTTTGNRVPFCRGGNMHILNNTIGNKRTINYVSQLVVAGTFYSANGYLLEVRNNLCFHTVSTGADRIVKQNTPDPLRDTSNNIYSEDPVAEGILEDTVECRLDPSGRAAGAGINMPFIQTDIDGVPRHAGSTADIGARESAPGKRIPAQRQGALPLKWIWLAVGTLMVALLAFFLRKLPVRSRGRKAGFVRRGELPDKTSNSFNS